MSSSLPWLSLAKRLQAIAQAGLYFTESSYDRERYQELSDLSVEILRQITDEPVEKITTLFASERDGYQTPKVDVRAIVFNQLGEILLVKERVDNRWALPGGWADVGYTPKEVAEKEVREETGLVVKARRLLALMDKRCHPHPVEPWYCYKLFILCERISGEVAVETAETSEVKYFSKDNLPPLSEPRNLLSQVQLMFEYYQDPKKELYLD